MNLIKRTTPEGVELVMVEYDREVDRLELLEMENNLPMRFHSVSKKEPLKDRNVYQNTRVCVCGTKLPDYADKCPNCPNDEYT